MHKKFGFAIIGCGRISPKHIEAVINNYPDAKLIAVSDLVLERMGQAIAFYQSYIGDNNLEAEVHHIRKYQLYQELLNDQEIDIVLIATESGYHARITIDVLNAGKHVIVEKPMALTTRDAEQMISLAREKGLKLAVCHQNRFNPTIQKLREALAAGRFGKLVHAVASIRWNRSQAYFNMDNWHGTLELDGGILMNQCIHNIDILRWMMGDIDRLYAESDTFLRDIETEDTAMGVIRFNNGAIGVIEGTVCVYPENLEETFNIFGEKGTVRVTGIALNNIIDWKFADNSPDEESRMKNISYETETVYGYGHNLLFKDVIEAIKKDREPLVNGVEGKKAIELILGIYKSSRTGQTVKFPLGDYSTKTDINLA